MPDPALPKLHAALGSVESARKMLRGREANRLMTVENNIEAVAQMLSGNRAINSVGSINGQPNKPKKQLTAAMRRRMIKNGKSIQPSGKPASSAKSNA